MLVLKQVFTFLKGCRSIAQKLQAATGLKVTPES
jgi:hypothetical protein